MQPVTRVLLIAAVCLLAACEERRAEDRRAHHTSDEQVDAGADATATDAPTDNLDAAPSDASSGDAGEAIPPHDAGQPPVVEQKDPAAPRTVRCTGSEVVTSQAYLDEFFKGCTAIDDSVYIDANTVDNLDALSEVETIGGELVIGPGVTYPLAALAADTSRVRLKSLSALSKLRSVRALRLRQLPLTDLHGLERAEWDRLSLESLTELRSLEGLGKGGYNSVFLSKLRALKNLKGLRAGNLSKLTIISCGLTDLSGAETTGISELYISDAPALRTTAGLSTQFSQVEILNAPLLTDLALLRGGSELGYLFLTQLPALASLADLSSYTRLFSLGIHDCDGLRDLTGLENVRGLEWLEIWESESFETLDGLQDSTGHLNAISLWRLPALRSLTGLEHLEKLSALQLDDLPKLTQLRGLDSLASLDKLTLRGPGPVMLQGLERVTMLQQLTAEGTNLSSLEGLNTDALTLLRLKKNARLTSIAALGTSPTASKKLDQVAIESNPRLANLAGLEGVTAIGYLTIYDNGSLLSLRPLSALSSVTTAPVIQWNSQLPQCEIRWLAERLSFEPMALITNGPVGTCAP